MPISHRFFHPHAPFDPRRFSFYYGWVILVVAILTALAGIPGSPAGLSPFIQSLLDSFSLTRTQITFTYMAGTVLAGLVTWRAGPWFDRHDPRIIASLALFGLAAAFLLMALSPGLFQAARALGGPPVLATLFALGLLFVTFFLQRLLGFGVLVTLTRAMLARWFTRHRAIAVATLGIVTSLCFSSAPLLLLGLTRRFSWTGTWLAITLVFGLFPGLLAYLFFRRSPQDVGLPPETDPAPHGAPADALQLPGGERHFPVYRDFSAREASRHFTFLVFLTCLVLQSLSGTGIILNLVSLGADQGVGETSVLALLPPSSLINVGISLILGAIGHRADLRWILLVFLVGIYLQGWGALLLGGTIGNLLFITGVGVAWGCFGLLINLPWPRYFGHAHLGSINGMVTGIIISCSALGPFLFGTVRDLTQSYQPALLASCALVPFLVVAAVAAHNPQTEVRRRLTQPPFPPA